MVVLLSPSAMESSFVRSDIEHALTSSKFENRLIAVLVEPTPAVPWILHRLQYIDATGSKDEAARRVVEAFHSASSQPSVVRHRGMHV